MESEGAANLYVPLRMFVEEAGPTRGRITYDLPSATLAQFDSASIDDVGRRLDEKVAALLTDAEEAASRAVETSA